MLEALCYAIAKGEGIVKVVGEVGSGKTMLCRMLERELPDNCEIIYLANPRLNADEILYAITNGRLPCPDTDGDGLSNPIFNGTVPATAICTGEGFVPWVELSAPQGDAWGNRFRYQTRSPQFTLPETDGICNGDTAAIPEFDLCATGNIAVVTRGDDPATAPAIEGKALLNLAQNLPAVIISHGRNGFGATNITGIARAAPPATNADELENTDGDTTFLTRIFTGENGGCTDDADEGNSLCEYDDIIKWISPALLNNRMVVSGQLP